MRDRTGLIVAVAAVAAAVVAAFAGLGDPSAGCLPLDCDCERVGAGPIRQPWNAWSSLALAAAGLRILTDRSVAARWVGGAAVGSGIAAFWMHAALSSWTARLDGIAIAALLAALAAVVWRDRILLLISLAVSAAAVAAAALAGTPALNPAALGFGAAAAAGLWRRCRGRSTGLLGLSAILLAGGGTLWWLGGSDGPWCLPDGPILHAGWHVMAAAALMAAWLQLRRCSP